MNDAVRQDEEMVVYTIREVAKLLKVSDRHVRRITAEGEDRLPAVRVGAAVRYRRADVMDWLGRQLTK